MPAASSGDMTDASPSMRATAAGAPMALRSAASNGMAEAFVRTIKRDYVRVSPSPDAQTVMHQLSAWINHYKRASQHPSVYVIEENRLC
jgi:thioredoxin-like negative regulator of GroEL